MSLTKHMMERLDAQNFEWEFSIQNQEKSGTEECADKMRKAEQVWADAYSRDNEALTNSIINSMGIQGNDTALYRTICNFGNYYQPSATIKYPYVTGDFQVDEETKEPVYHSKCYDLTNSYVGHAADWSDIAADEIKDARDSYIDSYIRQHSLSYGYPFTPDLDVNNLYTTQSLGFYPESNLPVESKSSITEEQEAEQYAPEDVINYLDEVSKRLEFLPLKDEIYNLITKIETKLSGEVEEDEPVLYYDGRCEEDKTLTFNLPKPVENVHLECEIVNMHGGWFVDQSVDADLQRTELEDMPWDQFKHMLDDFSC